MLYLSSRSVQQYEPVAVLLEPWPVPLVELRNQVKVGEVIEYMQRGLGVDHLRVIALRDEDGVCLEKANPGSIIFMSTEPPFPGGEANGIFRRKKAG